jgi:hypothetical protein
MCEFSLVVLSFVLFICFCFDSYLVVVSVEGGC